MEETCKWKKVASLVWQTGCDHKIGTHPKWEPEGVCMCCKKPVEVEDERPVGN